MYFCSNETNLKSGMTWCNTKFQFFDHIVKNVFVGLRSAVTVFFVFEFVASHGFYGCVENLGGFDGPTVAFFGAEIPIIDH